jgi:hypothetical protein
MAITTVSDNIVKQPYFLINEANGNLRNALLPGSQKGSLILYTSLIKTAHVSTVSRDC